MENILWQILYLNIPTIVNIICNNFEIIARHSVTATAEFLIFIGRSRFFHKNIGVKNVFWTRLCTQLTQSTAKIQIHITLTNSQIQNFQLLRIYTKTITLLRPSHFGRVCFFWVTHVKYSCSLPADRPSTDRSHCLKFYTRSNACEYFRHYDRCTHVVFCQ